MSRPMHQTSRPFSLADVPAQAPFVQAIYRSDTWMCGVCNVATTINKAELDGGLVAFQCENCREYNSLPAASISKVVGHSVANEGFGRSGFDPVTDEERAFWGGIVF